MKRTTLAFRSDWPWLRDTYAGFTFCDATADWLRGDWFVVSVALLGFRLTLTRWSGVPVESLGREVMYEDGQVVNLGREHGA
jgi:hypothetical protein